MNIKNKLLPLLIATASLTAAGCDTASESPWSPSGGSSNNIVSAKNFSLVFSDLSPDVYETATSITTNGIEVEVTVNAGDRFQAKVTGGTVFFRTEVGLLDNSSCELVDGSCTVTWFSNIVPGDVPADGINTISAYMIGEEGFSDLNGNGIFDDGDIFTHDSSDPFLDLSHDGNNPTYNPGVDALIVDTDYTDANALYSGSGCAHSSLCASTTRTYIYDTQEMDLAY